MGQKTHPKGFRLITTQTHLSSWYNDKLAYKVSLEEDNNIRRAVKKRLNAFLILSEIEIARVASYKSKLEEIEVFISVLFPTENEMLKALSTYASANQIVEKPLDSHLNVDSLGLSNPNTFLEINQEIQSIKAGANYCLKDGISILLHQMLREIAQNFQKETGKIFKFKIRLIENQFDDARLIARLIAEQLEQRVPFRRTLKQVLSKINETTENGAKIQISGRLNGADIARSEWKREGKIPLHTLSAKIDYAHHIAHTSSGILGIKVWLLIP